MIFEDEFTVNEPWPSLDFTWVIHTAILLFAENSLYIRTLFKVYYYSLDTNSKVENYGPGGNTKIDSLIETFEFQILKNKKHFEPKKWRQFPSSKLFKGVNVDFEVKSTLKG